MSDETLAGVLAHKHLIVRAELNDPPYLPLELNSWLTNLVDKIGMKILRGPYSVYSDMPGNTGLTGFVIIETSHIAVHLWDGVEPALMSLDVYTCSELNLEDVFEELQQFNPVKIEYKFIDREFELELVSQGIIHNG